MWCLWAQGKYSIRFSTRSQLGHKMHALSSFSISLLSLELTIFFILFTNTTLSISLILGRVSYMNFLMGLARHRAPWLSGRASERGIRRSEVRFLVGTQNFFFVLRSWQDEKHLSQFLYRAQNLLSFLFFLQGINYSTIVFSF